ncbi:Site-specific tyrosine integrase/recombinase [Pseudomonas savastanoi pv. glycinea]|nr:Site-specific tyrosine integrase/recombinase [Pseudomonas savastanoi pv. glycinea]
MSVLWLVSASSVALVTTGFTNDRKRANDEKYMHELTKAPKNDQRRLTSVEFQALAQVPAAVQWFANLDNPRT